MKLISYYDLLGMIKEENIPDKIYLHMLGKKVAYIKDVDMDEFNGYMLDDPNKDQDDKFKYYLGECFLESSMYDECIEIEGDKKINLGESIANALKPIIDIAKKFEEAITPKYNYLVIHTEKRLYDFETGIRQASYQYCTWDEVVNLINSKGIDNLIIFDGDDEIVIQNEISIIKKEDKK